MSDASKKSVWTLSFTLLVLVVFFTSMFSIGLNNGITLYGERTGMTGTESGFLVSAFMITASLVRLLTGEVTDKHDSKKVFLWGISVSCIGCFMPFISESYPFLVLTRLIQGVGFSFATTASAVMLAEVVPSERLGEGMAYRGLGTALATALGPTVAVVLVGLGDASMVFFGFGSILALSLALGAAVKVPPRHLASAPEAAGGFDEAFGNGSDSARELELDDIMRAKGAPVTHNGRSSALGRFVGRWIEMGLLSIMFVELFRRIVTGTCTSFMVIYGMHAGVAHPSVFFVISSTAIISFRLLGSKLFDAADVRRLLGAAFAIGIFGFLLLYFAPSALAYYAAGVFFGVVEGIGSPCLNTLTFRHCPENRWGTASANFHLTGDAGVAVGAFVCGWCMDNLGNNSVPLVPVFSLIIALVLALKFLPKGTGQAESVTK